MSCCTQGQQIWLRCKKEDSKTSLKDLSVLLSIVSNKAFYLTNISFVQLKQANYVFINNSKPEQNSCQAISFSKSGTNDLLRKPKITRILKNKAVNVNQHRTRSMSVTQRKKYRKKSRKTTTIKMCDLRGKNCGIILMNPKWKPK